MDVFRVYTVYIGDYSVYVRCDQWRQSEKSRDEFMAKWLVISIPVVKQWRLGDEPKLLLLSDP